jgi:hypothetical protein
MELIEAHMAAPADEEIVARHPDAQVAVVAHPVDARCEVPEIGVRDASQCHAAAMLLLSGCRSERVGEKKKPNGGGAREACCRRQTRRIHSTSVEADRQCLFYG